MKTVVSLAALAVVGFGSCGFAADGQVPAAVLQGLGLHDMEPLSDEQGMNIRGSGGNAMARGLSLVASLLIDQSTNSFVSGTDANAAMSSAENAGAGVWTRASSSQQSAVNLNLGITSANGVFTGVLIGGSGGSAFGSSR